MFMKVVMLITDCDKLKMHIVTLEQLLPVMQKVIDLYIYI